jgi:hypothetical protein
MCCYFCMRVLEFKQVRKNKSSNHSLNQGMLQVSASDDPLHVKLSISPFFLELALRHSDNESYVSPVVDKILIKILALRPNFSWKSFEQFHSLFEVLRYTLLAAGSTRDVPVVKTLSQLYPGALTAKSSEAALSLDLPIETRTLKELPCHQSAQEVDDGNHYSSVVVPAENNPGFDLALPFPGVSIFVELKYSAPNKSTYLSIDDIWRKHALVGSSKSGTYSRHL